jgi:hypothetical protein
MKGVAGKWKRFSVEQTVAVLKQGEAVFLSWSLSPSGYKRTDLLRDNLE